MLDQFGLEVGPGFVGGGGDTVQSLSLANGGDGSGGWDDPGVQAQYAQTQQDVAAIRDWMAATGQPYLVTGSGSMANENAGDSVAYLPSMMEAAGVKPTTGILNSYQNLVGSPYESGQVITGYNPNTNQYAVEEGKAGVSSSDLMAQYLSQPVMPPQLAQQPVQQVPQVTQPPQQPQAPQLGGLGQLAAGTQVPVSQSINTPASVPTTNAVSDLAIQNWFAANPGWTPETLKAYMVSYGITPEQMARATGNRPEVLVERYNRTGRQPAQAGAQTQYVDYTQPLAPVAEGAGSSSLPYYYNTPKGQVGSYLPPAYWRGNVQSYGGMYPFARGGEVKSASSYEWLKAKCNG